MAVVSPNADAINQKLGGYTPESLFLKANRRISVLETRLSWFTLFSLLLVAS